MDFLSKFIFASFNIIKLKKKKNRFLKKKKKKNL